MSGKLPSWGTTGLFQQSFGRLFVGYRELKLTNLLKQFQATKPGKETAIPMSDDQFVATYGPPPWDVVNDTFHAAGLGFLIDHPDEFEHTPYQPKLTKTGADTSTIRFNDLSSGEKILMSFALCLYYAEDNRQTTAYPRLLLFDEVDAPLHPSMSRNMIRIITEVLVKKHGINVIATTHSASTVALAPEDALFVMESGIPGVRKTTRSAALNILTTDVPTLAFSYDGRRQVFVESVSDAPIYDEIYRTLKSRLGSERSLEFVGTGMKSAATGAEVHSGCDVVLKLVTTLVAAGNLSVFGLVDWDKKHKAEARISVLAEGTRDGLENVMLDPLVVAALVLRTPSADRARVGVLEGVSYLEFLGWSPEKLQAVVDQVQSVVLGADSGKDTLDCRYVGGFALKLRETYVKMDDHALEARVLAAFPQFKAYSKDRAGALMLHIAETVMADQPDFIPTELYDTFQKLLTAPSHIETKPTSQQVVAAPGAA